MALAQKTLPRQGFETLSPAIGEASNYTRWILASFAPYIKGDVLEIGVGHANYLRFLGNTGSYTGLDIDAGIVTQARAAHPGKRFEVADICEAGLTARFGPFDTAICFNVLQYVSGEALAIRNMLGLLKPGGHALLLVPAMRCLMGQMDVLAGHRYRYTRGDMQKYIRESGGELVRLRYFNPVGAVGWWVNNRKKHDSLEDDSIASQIALFDRYAVPVSKAIDPLTRSFFGQSLLCAIRKP